MYNANGPIETKNVISEDFILRIYILESDITKMVT